MHLHCSYALSCHRIHPLMPELKQRLIELIEAYAAAKASGNALLIQSAGAGLSSLLDTLELTEQCQEQE